MIKEKFRKENNETVLRWFREGRSLSSFDPEISHFPPRPIIKKNKDALEVIFKKETSKLTSIKNK